MTDSPTTAPTPYMTTAEAARYLSCSQDTITRWARAGELRGFALGRRGGYRFTQADLDAFVASRPSQRQAPPPADSLVAHGPRPA